MTAMPVFLKPWLLVTIVFAGIGISTAMGGAVNLEFGGHVKTRGQMSDFNVATPIREFKDNPFYDGAADLRLNAEVFAGERIAYKAHYEAAVFGGNTRENENAFLMSLSNLPSFFSLNPEPDDDGRLFDFTSPLDEEDDYYAYHRLDRLSLTYQGERAMVRLGRQAVSWGNGMLFNPMDLFNPFAPTTIDKDYKTGDDMVFGQITTDSLGEWQLLYIPRRDLADHNVKWQQSSLAVKTHQFAEPLEIDLMAAWHFSDAVVGMGLLGYLEDAAWRFDATWTFLNDSGKSGYPSLVANMDYSWVLWGRNFYGFIECYFNGLGRYRYDAALLDTEITDRLGRGELFVLSRSYLCGHLKMEAHPLVNLYLTVITNLHDPSGTVQPKLTWDLARNINLTLGADLYYGSRGTEFGGIELPGTDYMLKSADSFYVWAAFYF